jgi:hypothetical protein
MRARRAIRFLLAALAGVTGCRPATAPEAVPAATPPVVRAYRQFTPGDTLDLVRVELGLDNYEARYRSSLPEGSMGVVYFMDEGNLHIDAKKVGETWVLVSVPLLEPSSVPARERVAEWDLGADAQNLKGEGQK